MSLRTGVILDIELTGPASPPCLLKIRLIDKKNKTNWCWAACAAMVLRYLKSGYASMTDAKLLCYVAEHSKYGPSGDCCKPYECDGTLKAPEVTDLWESFVYDSTQGIIPDYKNLANRPAIDELINEITVSRRPVEIGFKYGKSGHLIILYGYVKENNVRYFYLHDPDAPENRLWRISETELLSKWNGEEWEDTWMRLEFKEN
jgi:hypothetical protein